MLTARIYLILIEVSSDDDVKKFELYCWSSEAQKVVLLFLVKVFPDLNWFLFNNLYRTSSENIITFFQIVRISERENHQCDDYKI